MKDRNNAINIWRGHFPEMSIGILLTTCILMAAYTREPAPEVTPDAVGSMSINQEEHLIVVANNDTIPDKEAFARKVIHMCQENTFHTIKFSTDVNGFPTRLDISVYLWAEEIGQQEPACIIEYAPLGYHEEYDIKNDQEQFHLYLNDKEIEFY